MEEWKRIYINGTETVYEISNTGRCRNITKKSWKTKGVLRPRVNNKSGYVQYCIVHQSKKYYMYAHRLVATYFLEENKNLQVNHKDGDKQNNHKNNLEWVTGKENMRHCFDTGLSNIPKPIVQYTLTGQKIAEYKSESEAARALNIDVRTICNGLINKEGSQACGYQWRYTNDKRKVSNISKSVKFYSRGVIQLTIEGDFVNYFSSITDAYKVLNKTDNGAISQVCKGNRNSFAGYKWVYEQDYKKSVDEDIVYSPI
ncbi:NUMOD1 domain-containing DNA-binding protein [Bacillus licheniformis]|uniref:NUMOD1 domain-containing DNA-binding protein n=1 Tax=Bacillus licheniformis TaxID=1402 RepID=UPI00115E3D4C|nr:NUMOD1 domain-containing DNA-binding protein [Bacillus licheniformis]MBW7632634.1 HNH endonuclease [Bacillus licheniformis]MED4408437.1 NUMOD1 domain-containing DNA-binding protein [Bacillus licheniformis]QDL79986.1 hypothetical protein D9Y32_22475 [Bacillus licheniformis]